MCTGIVDWTMEWTMELLCAVDHTIVHCVQVPFIPLHSVSVSFTEGNATSYVQSASLLNDACDL